MAEKVRDDAAMKVAVGVLIDHGLSRAELTRRLTDAVEMARTLHDRLGYEERQRKKALKALKALDTIERWVGDYNDETIPYHGVAVEWDDPHVIDTDETGPGLARIREAADYRIRVATIGRDGKINTIPFAVSAFPNEIYTAPKSWAEKAYPKLIYYNEIPKGTHFAAWEQPKFYSEEVRAGFRSLR